MRVITGKARGRRLKTPPGMETRPTAEAVKEGIFSALQFQLEGRRVLDLFAGTGQLGIEALSRGAAFAVFVERKRETAALVRENLRLTGLEGQARVVCGGALEYLARAGEPFDLIFMDPPYAAGAWEKALGEISRRSLLSVGGQVLCEAPREMPLPQRVEGLTARKTYRYGRVTVTLYRREEES